MAGVISHFFDHDQCLGVIGHFNGNCVIFGYEVRSNEFFYGNLIISLIMTSILVICHLWVWPGVMSFL